MSVFSNSPLVLNAILFLTSSHRITTYCNSNSMDVATILAIAASYTFKLHNTSRKTREKLNCMNQT